MTKVDCMYTRQCSCPSCIAFRKSLQAQQHRSHDDISSAEASPEEIAKHYAPTVDAPGGVTVEVVRQPIGPVLLSQNTVRAAKRKAYELLNASKAGKPLDQAQLQLALRGYLGVLDLILAVSDSSGTHQ